MKALRKEYILVIVFVLLISTFYPFVSLMAYELDDTKVEYEEYVKEEKEYEFVDFQEETYAYEDEENEYKEDELENKITEYESYVYEYYSYEQEEKENAKLSGEPEYANITATAQSTPVENWSDFLTALNDSTITEIIVSGNANNHLTIPQTYQQEIQQAILIPTGRSITITSATSTAVTILTDTTNSYRHFDVQGSLTLNNIILSGNGTNLHGGITIENGGTLTLNNGTIIEGNIWQGDNAVGGVDVLSGTLTMNGNASIQGNKILVGTGNQDAVAGVRVHNGSTFTMNDTSSVSGNTASAGIRSAGGVRVDAGGTFVMNGSSTISGNAVQADANVTSSEAVGGLLVNGGTVHMSYMTGDASVITGNSVPNDPEHIGGVRIINSGTLSMENHANITNHANGGVVIDSGELDLRGNTSISGNGFNTAVVRNIGGGVQVNAGGTLHMQGPSSINNNQASQGGGVYINGGTVTMINTSNLTGNTASQGGGVYINAGTLTIGETASNDLTTIASNTANIGGGIYVSASGRFTAYSGDIKNNTATTNISNGYIAINGRRGTGGGIFTELYADYSNLNIGSSVIFSGNQAQGILGTQLPPSNATTAFPNIQTTIATSGGHPLNNRDINYISVFKLAFYDYHDALMGTAQVLGYGNTVNTANIVDGNYPLVVGSVPDTTRAGLFFENWFTSQMRNTVWNVDSVLSSDLTLYGTWAGSIEILSAPDISFGTNLTVNPNGSMFPLTSVENTLTVQDTRISAPGISNAAPSTPDWSLYVTHQDANWTGISGQTITSASMEILGRSTTSLGTGIFYLIRSSDGVNHPGYGGINTATTWDLSEDWLTENIFYLSVPNRNMVAAGGTFTTTMTYTLSLAP